MTDPVKPAPMSNCICMECHAVYKRIISPPPASGLREAVVKAAIQWYCADDDFIDVRTEWLEKAVRALPEFTGDAALSMQCTCGAKEGEWHKQECAVNPPPPAEPGLREEDLRRLAIYSVATCDINGGNKRDCPAILLEQAIAALARVEGEKK